MYLYVVYISCLCVASAFAAAPVKQAKSERPSNDPKLKREAPISNANGYDGALYKYLPPRTSPSPGVYENYRGSPQSSYVNVGTYRFADASAVGGHTNEHGSGSVPRVETYIIQTQTAHKDHAAPQSAVGYRFPGTSAPLKVGYNNLKSGYSGGYSAGHDTVQKYKTVFIPVQGFADSGYTRFNGNSGSSDSFSYSKGVTSPYFSSGSYAGKNYDTKLATLGSSENGAYSSIDTLGGQRLQSYNHGNTISAQSQESDYSGKQAEYSYEKPIASFSHGSQTPSSSYGASPSYQSPAYREDEKSLQQPPSYATGHKGLGHFSYEARRPHPLSADFADSSQYPSSYGNTAFHGHSSIISQAPFKPSVFLGLNSDHGITRLPNQHSAPAPEQYVPPPPTSAGYEYSSESGHYTPSHQLYIGGEYKDSADEQALAYQSNGQQASYGPPATPSDKYLPPN